MGSYTSQATSLGMLFTEAYGLYQNLSNDIPGRVEASIRDLRAIGERVQGRYGLVLRDCDVLDIGAGQLLIQMMCFSQFNRVVGIDWDVIAQGIEPWQYARMFYFNGPRRTIKTIIRKLLGVDRRYRKEVKGQLGLRSFPRLQVRRMDACKMTFPSQSFDFVHSRSVFHHLPDPATAISEVVRVLRPGGVAYLGMHLFTSENGCLDPRIYRDEQGEVVLWPHLRASYAKLMNSNAFLNKYRLDQWRRVFSSHMPGAEFIANRSPRVGIERDAEALLHQGEILGYTLEELVVHDLVVLWRKPCAV